MTPLPRAGIAGRGAAESVLAVAHYADFGQGADDEVTRLMAGFQPRKRLTIPRKFAIRRRVAHAGPICGDRAKPDSWSASCRIF
ncbi:MAG: hypothetical protein P8X69_13385 [Maritimibacter sp.]